MFEFGHKYIKYSNIPSAIANNIKYICITYITIQCCVKLLRIIFVLEDGPNKITPPNSVYKNVK